MVGETKKIQDVGQVRRQVRGQGRARGGGR